MTRMILMLRGINVGGRNILPMKDLRALLTEFGYENIRTYIQSGNCIFDAPGKHGTPQEQTDKIENAIESKFGFRPKAILIGSDVLKAAIVNNPYPVPEADLKTVHFYFLAEPAKHADLDAIDAIRKPTEAYTLTDTVFYLHAPEGIGRSKLAASAEKKLGVVGTGRNLRTALKIAEMAEEV